VDLAALAAALARHGLAILGGLHPGADDAAPEGTGTLILAGPDGPRLWRHFRDSPEAGDGRADPLDRWTRRIMEPVGRSFGATVLYPFGEPPFHPFIRWALASGACSISPVGLLVHHRHGLFVSFRAAFAFPGRHPLSEAGRRPCDACPAPCRDACPVGALGPGSYDVPACRAHVGQAQGRDCREEGCAVRRACPVGRDLAPPRAQRAFHMAAFHGRQGSCSASS
jgi:epoxyqueuosine reductase